MNRYVGVTGFTSRAEVDAALAALPDGLTLMCGVLVSEKTVRGERNRWWRRYPRVEEIADIFSPDERCLNLIHYCADEPPDFMVLKRLYDLSATHGFQFNGAWPFPETLAGLEEMDVVLQVKPGARDRDSLSLLEDFLELPFNPHVLIDASGGRGLPIDPDVADAWGMTIRGHFGPDVGLGFAGGLDAETLPRIAGEVRTWDASIDAEGRLRDGDEGGILNIDKVRAYLRAAGDVFRAKDSKR